MRNKSTAIQIISINVGRSSTAHEIALEIASTSHFDLLLVQEPYIFKDLTRRITRKHPCFDCYTPVDNWTRRPRVMSYTRKNSKFSVVQDRPFINNEHGAEDILLLTIKPQGRTPTQVINVYNAPPGGINSGAGVSFLISLPHQYFYSKTLLVGDFNPHHQNWQSSYQVSTSSQAEKFICWLESKNLSYISEIDTPTHS